MDINLKKAGHDYYRAVLFTPMAFETTRESIVPDSCPDIARIVETTAQVCVTGRELTGDGRLSFSGSVEVSVLYIPEKGEGVRSLRFPVPFQCFGDGRDEGEWAYPAARVHLQSIDTRLLNPRKVLTRAELTVQPVCCRKTEVSVCTGGEEDLQLLRREEESRVVAAVREKEFGFSEELPLSPGRGGVGEILSSRVRLQESDCKIIGTKLVVKGLADVAVLYREQSGAVQLLRQELPFSQVMEAGGAEESWEPEVEFQLCSALLRPGSDASPDDPHLLTLDLGICARVTLWRRLRVEFVSDLYSTVCPVSCQMGELTLAQNEQRQNRRQNVRELLETATAVKTVLDTQVECSPVQPRRERMELSLWARCLYLDENDALRSVRRELTVPLSGEWEEGVEVSLCLRSPGDVSAGILPEGVELRFTVEYRCTTCRQARFPLVLSAQRREEGEEAPPSLVLRMPGGGEDLWTLAKQYRTTCRAILEANGLEENAILPRDRLLLIPRWRG